MGLTIQQTLCGFCNDGNHDKCAIGIKFDESRGAHKKYPEGIVWACRCTDGSCTTGRLKCSYCGNRTTEEIDPTTWECLDRESCRTTVQTRRDNDPFLAQLREIQETVNMAKIENDKAKAEKVQKAKEPTFCLVTGEPTKGGKFKPGMDARYVSDRVTECINGNFSAKVEKEQRSKMKNDGVSDALVAKFEKSLALAKDKAEKKAAAAKAKADAKAEKASA